MSAAGAIAAAAITRAERRIFLQLRTAGALSADKSSPLVLEKGLQERRLSVLPERGVVIETSPGLYWLDEAAVLVDQARRRKTAMIAMLAVVVVSVIIGLALLTAMR